MRTIALLCCAALSLSACQKSPEERVAEAVIEQATGQKMQIDRDGERITVKTEDGEVKMAVGDGLALPAAFPKDLYLPGDYAVRSVMESGNVLLVTVNAPGEVAGLYEEARAAMQGQGWEQVMAMQPDADNRMLLYRKEKRTASVTLGREDESVNLVFQLAEEQ